MAQNFTLDTVQLHGIDLVMDDASGNVVLQAAFRLSTAAGQFAQERTLTPQLTAQQQNVLNAIWAVALNAAKAQSGV